MAPPRKKPPPPPRRRSTRSQPTAEVEVDQNGTESGNATTDTTDSDVEEQEPVQVNQRKVDKKKGKKPDYDAAGPSSRRGKGQAGGKNRGNEGRGRRQDDSGSGSDFVNNDNDDDPDSENEGVSADKIKDMVTGVVRDLLLCNSSKTILTKASIIKNHMDGKRKLFVKIIRDAQVVLDEICGFKVVALDKGSQSGYNSNFDNSSTQFFLSSIFSTMSVSEYNDYIDVKTENAEHLLLSSMLSVIFMKFFDVGVRGEIIWESIMVKLGLADKLNVKQNDFHRYLKKEYMDLHYLTATEDRTDNEEVFYRYNWGPRANLEFSKPEILLYTAKILDVPFFSFHTQLQIISNELSLEEFDKFLEKNMDQNTQRLSRMLINRDRDDTEEEDDEIEELINV